MIAVFLPEAYFYPYSRLSSLAYCPFRQEFRLKTYSIPNPLCLVIAKARGQINLRIFSRACIRFSAIKLTHSTQHTKFGAQSTLELVATKPEEGKPWQVSDLWRKLAIQIVLSKFKSLQIHEQPNFGWQGSINEIVKQVNHACIMGFLENEKGRNNST